MSKDDLYLGFMSGTSCDGVDVSIIRTDGNSIFESLYNTSIIYDSDLRQQLKTLFQNPKSLFEVEKKITNLHVDVGKKLLLESGYLANKVRAVGFHGQTIIHKPEEGFTWQIGNPHILAKELGIDIVHDFRRKDMAYGGQGAPLIPIFHKLLLKNQPLPSVIINIGGVANLTYIDQENIIAFDTGPGNALIDDLVMQYCNQPYDNKGRISGSGIIDKNFVNKVLSDKYYNLPYPKSLDRNSFKGLLNQLKVQKYEDAIASVTYLTPAAIVQSLNLLPNKPKQIFVCGGGTKNTQMLSWLKELLLANNIYCNLSDISQLSNLDSDYVESQGFAYLAARFCNNLPSTFFTTTGVIKANICGCLVQP